MNDYWKEPELPAFRVQGWVGEDMLVCLQDSLPVTTSVGVITIQRLFLSDGLSIPAIVRPLVGPATGRPFVAGLLHDFLYSRSSTAHYPMEREDADELFLEVMTNLKIGRVRRMLIYRAVRCFGKPHWKKK